MSAPKLSEIIIERPPRQDRLAQLGVNRWMRIASLNEQSYQVA